MKPALAFALVLVPLFGACASPSSTRESRSTLVAADIERDLARVDTQLTAAALWITKLEPRDRRERLEKILFSGVADRDIARAELAAYRSFGQVERVRRAADAAARAQRQARAAERGEDLFLLE